MNAMNNFQVGKSYDKYSFPENLHITFKKQKKVMNFSVVEKYEIPFQLGALYHIGSRYWYLVRANYHENGSNKTISLQGVKVKKSDLEKFKSFLTDDFNLYDITNCFLEMKKVEARLTQEGWMVSGLKEIIYSNREIQMDKYLKMEKSDE